MREPYEPLLSRFDQPDPRRRRALEATLPVEQRPFDDELGSTPDAFEGLRQHFVHSQTPGRATSSRSSRCNWPMHQPPRGALRSSWLGCFTCSPRVDGSR
ncbi:MAG: hypothetical protein MZU91_12955 [Desulfosudis oleivorans]|nr:hypothetical protein [Desulfosudis oleivorans]